MKLKRHKSFLKDWRKINLSDEHFEKFITYSNNLKANVPLPEESRDHDLTAEYKDCREFHLGGDMLVIYRCCVDEIEFIRMGSHSQLFK